MCALVIDIDRPSSSVLPPVRPSVPRLSADFPFGHVVGVVRSAANALQCPIRRPSPSSLVPPFAAVGQREETAH